MVYTNWRMQKSKEFAKLESFTAFSKSWLSHLTQIFLCNKSSNSKMCVIKKRSRYAFKVTHHQIKTQYKVNLFDVLNGTYWRPSWHLSNKCFEQWSDLYLIISLLFSLSTALIFYKMIMSITGLHSIITPSYKRYLTQSNKLPF